MEPNGQVLPCRNRFILHKKDPRPCDSFGMMEWLALELGCLYESNGMVGSEMVLEREGYGMGWKCHSNGIGMEPIYHTLEWVPLRFTNSKNWVTS